MNTPMTLSMRAFTVSLAGLAAAGALALSGPAPAAKLAPPAMKPEAQRLVPHRAVYKMTLASANGGSGVVGAQGVMMYVFAETCADWTAETNVFLKLQYADGPEASSTWSFVATESKDGLGYRFRLKHVRDGEVLEQFKGSAALEAVGGAGRAVFKGAGKDAGDATMALPKGTMFPTAHLVRVIEAAGRGKRFLPEIVFDGASLDNPYRITASIGHTRAAAGAGVAAALEKAGLKAEKTWPMRLAFFPHDSRRPEPEFEIGVDYRPDGIAERVLQDYGAFAIDMLPAEIEVLRKPDCS